MKCPKCGSENVIIQAVTVTKIKNHGCLWWLCVSWWIWIVWLAAFIPMLILKIFKGTKIQSKTHSEAVCQNCGHRWRV
jgi:predicted nucleic-acid-binding Zn-ribbon protein